MYQLKNQQKMFSLFVKSIMSKEMKVGRIQLDWNKIEKTWAQLRAMSNKTSFRQVS